MRFFLKYSYKIVAYEKIVQLFKNINSDKQTYKKLIKLGDLTGLVYLESLNNEEDFQY